MKLNDLENTVDSRVWTEGRAISLNDGENHNAMTKVRTTFLTVM